MQTPTTHRRHAVRFNMTPMIDVVFLLIIFFLVSSHLAQQETQVKLALPSASSGHESRDSDIPRVTINVKPNGDILLAAKVVMPGELQRRLQVEQQRAKKLEVRIRGDRQVEYRYIEPILLAAARTGVWNVGIAVVKPER